MPCLPAHRHGEAWREFRSRVQRPCLQPKTVRTYIGPIEDVTNCFLQRYVHRSAAGRTDG